MKPTVSVMITSRSSGKRSRRLSGIERRKGLVGSPGVAVGQGIQQGGFAGIGVADDRDHRHVLALTQGAFLTTTAAQRLDLLLQPMNALADTPTLDLKRRLTRATSANATGQTR